ncbi:MAG: HAMP domain-containing histidine kinase [Chloroflexota bacterium]|nr:HAMP domain-containing histidine kinase [Chloroflexota bacterium]
MTMKATQSSTYIDRRGRSMRRMSFEDRVRLRKNYVAQSPRWRHPVVGYLLSPFIVALCMLILLFLQKTLGVLHFSATFLILPVLFAALFWGVGPAIIAIILCTLLLDYYFIAPIGQLFSKVWLDASQLLPFVISCLTIALITAQRERARLKALATEQELQIYADELEATNKKLEEANETKDRFLSIASHELKTPVTTIRGQAQLMIRRLAKQHDPEMEEIGTTLNKINDQTKRLTTLIDELMDVSSIRAGKVELHKRKCDLKDVCREVVEDQRLLSGRVITLDAPSEPMKMQVDCERLAQVFVNLVGNAVKYSPEGSPVAVSIGKQDRVALVQVRDSGKGIPRDQQERIFETFYRAPDTQTSSKRGLGLGLAIAKDIIERHEGRIWCESEPGQGSTFFVELPLR